MASLKEKITDKKALIAVMGLGYVGLPTAIAFVKAGFKVIGIDKDPEKVRKLRSGKGYLPYISREDLLAARKISSTTDAKALARADVILICVPTPLNKNKAPDLSFIVSASNDIAKSLKKGQLVILESTTYPGTTDEIVQPILEGTGLKANRNFYLAFSPERIDPGNKKFDLSNTPKVVGGLNRETTKLCSLLYQNIAGKVVEVSSPRVAEMEKLLENIFRSVNIALANEMAMLSKRLKIDIWEVIGAASTKPYGFMPFYPGPGLGGHCIPLDPFYLTWKAKEHDMNTKFIELAGEINTGMPYYVVETISDALNKNNTSLKGAKVLVLGVAYKKDIDDVRESPALKIIEILRSKGAKVMYNDPFVPKISVGGKPMASTALGAATLKSCDCAAIITDHSSYDYPLIVKNSKCVVDTRNATQNVIAGRNKITKL
jgi:UDP-N-acetyl-D-glucosamine dehydrogenase